MAESRYTIGIDLDTHSVLAGLEKIETSATKSVEAIKASTAAGLPSFLTPQISTIASTAAADTNALAAASRSAGLTGEAAFAAHNLYLEKQFAQAQTDLGQSGPSYQDALKAGRADLAAATTDQTLLLGAENKLITKGIVEREARLAAGTQFNQNLLTPEGQAKLTAAAQARTEAKLARQDATLAAEGDEAAISRKAAAAVEAKRIKLTEQVEALQLELGYDTKSATLGATNIELQAQKNLLVKEYNAQVAAQAAEQRAGAGGNASLFQRLLAYSKGPNAIASEQQTAGQYAAAGLARTARLGGTIAGFAALAGIAEIVKYSADLEENFNKINAQLDAMGQANQIDAVHQGILDVSQSTGLAAKDVVVLEQEFLGLYQNVSLANEATDAAAKIIRTTGLSAQEAGPLLAAAAKDFGVSVQQLGDDAFTVQDKTGRSAKDAIQFFGDVAPVAQQYGISLKEIRGLAESLGVSSAKSFQQIAEGLNRELPQLQSSIPKLLQIPGLELSNKALGGDPLAILKDILAQYDKLAPAAQRAIIAIGGPRQAQLLATLFDDPAKALAALNDKTEDNGRLNKANQGVQESLSGSLKRLEQSFLQAGEAAFNGGLGQALTDLLKLLAGVGDKIKFVIDLFKGFNDALGGIPGRFLEIVAALALINKIGQIQIVANLLEALPRLIPLIRGWVASLRALTVAEAAANVASAGSGGLAAVGGGLGLGARGLRTGEAAGNLTAARAGATAVGTDLEAAAVLEGTGALSLGAATGVGAIVIGAGLLMAKLADDQKKHTVAKIKKIQDDLEKKTNEELGNALKTASEKPLDAPGGYSGTLDVSHLPVIGGPLGKVEDFFGGEKGKTSQRDLVIKQVRKNRAAQEAELFNKLNQAGVISESDYKEIQDDLNDPGDEGKYNDLQQKLIEITASGKGKAAFNAIAQANATKKAEAAAAAGLKDQTGLQVQTVSELQQSYAEGNLSLEEYLADLQKLEAGFQKAIDAGNPDPQLIKDVVQAKKAIIDAVSKQAKSDEQFAIEVEGLSGDNPATQALKNQAAALRLASNPQVDKATREGAAKEVVKYQQDSLTELIKSAQSADEIHKLITQPQAIPPEVQAAFAAAHPGQTVPTQQFASQAQKDAAAQRLKAINDSYRDLANSLTHDKLQQAQNDQGAAAQALQTALEAYGSNSPEYREALAAFNKVGTAIQDIHQARADAAEQLKEAVDARDPLKVAQDKIRKALSDLQTATRLGDPDKITAFQTALVQAQQAAADQVNNLLTAQANLAAAVADAAGHTADGIAIRLADLKRQAQLLVSEGGGNSPQYANLQAQIVQTQSSLDHQLRNDQKDYFEFLYATKQITGQQLITYLEQLASGIDQNTSEWRSLQQEIFNLKHQMSGNLAFNVPTAFDLPTLYEVRRLNASVQAGVGYTDNRQQVVNVFVTNGMSPAQVTQAVQGALATGAGRYGVA